jgi:membrane protease subunit HflK
MRYLGYVLLLLAAIYLFTGVVQVSPGERAVVRRFGRVVAKPSPGLWIGFPWGIDRVDRVPVDLVRRATVGYQKDVEDTGQATPPGQLLTGDHNLVNIQVAIDFAVVEDEVEEYVLQADRAERLIASACEAALAEWVAGRTVDEVLITGKAVLPGLLAEQTQARIRPYRLGVQIQGASVTHLFPPDEVKDAFDQVTRAQTAIRTREHEARQEAARRVREAEAERFRIQQQIAAYANERRSLAQAEADSFEKRLQQYHRLRQANPDFLAGIWWDEMSKLFARMKDNGRIDLLDNHLGSDGLDITLVPPLPKKQ